MKTEKKCADIVGESLQRELEVIEDLWAVECGEKPESEYGLLSEYGLCFDFVPAGTFSDQDGGYFRYQISWGGPAEEFRFYCDPQNVPYRIEFWYLDWFDGASAVLTGPDKELLLNIWGLFDELGCVKKALRGAG